MVIPIGKKILHYLIEKYCIYDCLQGSSLIKMKIQMPTDKSGTQSPSLAFLLLERYNGVKLVQSIHASLASLSKVIRGTQLLTNDVQKLAAALLEQEVRADDYVRIKRKLFTLFSDCLQFK